MRIESVPALTCICRVFLVDFLKERKKERKSIPLSIKRLIVLLMKMYTISVGGSGKADN